MEIQTVVKHRATGRLGVIVNDMPAPMNCCDGSEVLVVFDGTTYGSGTRPEELEVVGPENAVADIQKCGGGLGEHCCIFPVMGSNGPECQRFGSMRYTLIFRTMKAKRDPEKLFPHCQFSENEREEILRQMREAEEKEQEEGFE